MAAKIFLNFPGGKKMPAVGLGTWQSQNENELSNALDTALEVGYRHIDTAYAYENEKFIGSVLKKWFSSGKLKREDLFITTKLPMIGLFENKVEYFLKKSLSNLQLDYVDLYLIHFPVGVNPSEKNPDTVKIKANGDFDTVPSDHAAIWKKMEEQVDAGRTKSIGVSNFNIQQISNILKIARIKPANLQVELHVYMQQRELVDFCHKNNITVVAYSPLGSPGYNKFVTRLGQEPKELPNIFNNPVIKRIATKHKKTPAQIMLRFLLQRNIAVIPKSVTPARVKENINVFDFVLDEKDMKELYDLEVGESARICDFKVMKGLNKHPQFPFKQL